MDVAKDLSATPSWKESLDFFCFCFIFVSRNEWRDVLKIPMIKKMQGKYTFREIIDFFQSISCIFEWGKGQQFDVTGKFGKVIDRLLELL